MIGWKGQMAGTPSYFESLEGLGFPCLSRSPTLFFLAILFTCTSFIIASHSLCVFNFHIRVLSVCIPLLLFGFVLVFVFYSLGH